MGTIIHLTPPARNEKANEKAKEQPKDAPAAAEPLTIRVLNKSGRALPKKAYGRASGIDLQAVIEDGGHAVIPPHKSRLFNTGLFLELPQGYEAQVRPRSGMALKHCVTVLNSPGTIDSDYRGEVGVVLINHSDDFYTVYDGDRIAQLVVQSVPDVRFAESDVIDVTMRGKRGFGSTGQR